MSINIPRDGREIHISYRSTDYAHMDEPSIDISINTLSAYVSFPAEDPSKLVELIIGAIDEYREYLNTTYTAALPADSSVDLEWKVRSTDTYDSGTS